MNLIGVHTEPTLTINGVYDMNVVRSSAGTYHLGCSGASVCNGRSGKFRLADPMNVQAAAESCFCSKCFGLKNGSKKASAIARMQESA